MNSAARKQTIEQTRRIPAPLMGSDAPHPLQKLAERLGRSQGRQPLPDVFERFLMDQLTRPVVSREIRSAIMPSRDLTRSRRRQGRRADI